MVSWCNGRDPGWRYGASGEEVCERPGGGWAVAVRRWALVVAVTAAMVVAAAGPAAAVAGWTCLISLSDTGAQGNNHSQWTAISGDGRHVAFISVASNLVPGDTNGIPDMFVRDRLAGATTRVTVSSTGEQANAHDWEGFSGPVISTDGRFVAFTSVASNLVPGDTNNAPDVFVRDQLAGNTSRVSVSSSGGQADNSAGSFISGLSRDARYVVFNSWASNLVPGDTNGGIDGFLHDRVAGTTTRVTVSSNGEQASGDYVTISANGRYIAFSSSDPDLAPGDTNDAEDAFVRDLWTGTTRRISYTTTGEQPNGTSTVPAISPDGQYVAFISDAPNMVPGEPIYQQFDMYVRDLRAGTTRLVSMATDGTRGSGPSSGSAFSADSRYLVYASLSYNLVPDDTNDTYDVFVRDLRTWRNSRVSVSSTGAQANNGSVHPAISADGRYVAFDSGASNLVAGDTNDYGDVFVRRQGR
jgi:Tol biopolymer transport system component